MSHLFEIGRQVRYRSQSLVRDNGVYEVTRQMPAAEDRDPQYRVRNAAGQERAAREHELVPADANAMSHGAEAVSAAL